MGAVERRSKNTERDGCVDACIGKKSMSEGYEATRDVLMPTVGAVHG